ncbi:MAG: AsmA-like C-terminal region-containing protein [Verrucomicrobia subdivision 3 bacterium]|nr:AsmA-like C-terminal region-containing protein [Limisphaerales bacterium]
MKRKCANVEPLARRPKWKRILRTSFRWFRILVLLAAFLVVLTGFFLNKVGLPEFLKQRLINQARATGWEIEFSRVRLLWPQGIVADDLHLRRTNGLQGPNLFVQRAECGLNFEAFTHLKLDVNSFRLAGGRLVWPLSRPGETRRPFTLNDVAGELSFLPNDEWRLRFLEGNLLGAQVSFNGVITNGSLIRDWRIRRPRRPRPPGPDLWEKIVRIAAQLNFAEQPEIEGTFRGDAADLRSFEANLTFNAPGVASPWGSGTNLVLAARLFPGKASRDPGQADLALTAGWAGTKWGEASEVRLNLEVAPEYARSWPTNANLRIELKNAKTLWATGEYAFVTSRLTLCPTNAALAQSEAKALVKGFKAGSRSVGTAEMKLLATHPFTNWLPATVGAQCQFVAPSSEWGRAEAVALKLGCTLPEKTNLCLLTTNLAWPERLRSITLAAQSSISNLSSDRLEADRVHLKVDWSWPELMTTFEGGLYGGDALAKARVEVESRKLAFEGSSSFDVHRIAPLLTTNAQKFLSSYSWESPPKLRANGSLTLPPWTNWSADARAQKELLASVSLAGDFDVGAGSYKDVSFSAAGAPFHYTNQIWHIDGLRLRRPEGEFVGDYTSTPATKDFHWKLRSRIDPNAFKPLFKKDSEQKAFEFFAFTTPPFVEGEVWGNWRKPEHIGVVAKVAARDFKFRGEAIGEASTDLVFTNMFLALLNPQIKRPPNEQGVAPGIGIDFRQLRVWLTNAFGNLNPHAVARTIGRKTGLMMEDYVFDVSPTIRLNGSVDLKKGSDEDDLHFEISGGTFHWRQFNFQQIAGNIHWIGRTMSMTNMHGIFHGGRAMGYANFSFPRKRGTDFSFRVSLAEVDFHSFMTDVRGSTNQLEGMLNGELTVVSANSDERNSWTGYGNVHLRDGLIWDIPVFGLFSPILNAFVPGLGNSRASQAVANLLITNSIISTRDLEIRATGMRMKVQGTIGFEQNVNLRMEAELLRDLPAIGAVISKVFWPVTKMFEYEVTGTLAQPKAEPLYIVPKILLFPFQPIKTIKDMFPEQPKPPENQGKP